MVAERIAGQAARSIWTPYLGDLYSAGNALGGKAEQQLKAEGVAYRAGQVPFAHNGRALGQDETAGFRENSRDAGPIASSASTSSGRTLRR